jgi:hypothetical protein
VGVHLDHQDTTAVPRVFRYRILRWSRLLHICNFLQLAFHPYHYHRLHFNFFICPPCRWALVCWRAIRIRQVQGEKSRFTLIRILTVHPSLTGVYT